MRRVPSLKQSEIAMIPCTEEEAKAAYEELQALNKKYEEEKWEEVDDKIGELTRKQKKLMMHALLCGPDMTTAELDEMEKENEQIKQELDSIQDKHKELDEMKERKRCVLYLSEHYRIVYIQKGICEECGKKCGEK